MPYRVPHYLSYLDSLVEVERANLIVGHDQGLLRRYVTAQKLSASVAGGQARKAEPGQSKRAGQSPNTDCYDEEACGIISFPALYSTCTCRGGFFVHRSFRMLGLTGSGGKRCTVGTCSWATGICNSYSC